VVRLKRGLLKFEKIILLYYKLDMMSDCVSSTNINTYYNGVIKKFPKYIQTLLSNINGKAGKKAPCSMQRTNVKSRVTLPLSVLIKNGLFIMEFINRCNKYGLFEGGCYIEIINEELTELIESNDPEAKYLLDNLGGDNNIASFLHFTSRKGYSGSSEERKYYETKGIEYINEHELKPLCRKSECEGLVSMGNNNVEGHYLVNLSGGNNNTIQIPKLCNNDGKIKTEYQLFNMYYDYADSNVSIDRLVKFIYLFLHCHDIESLEIKNISEIIEKLEKYMNTREYDDGNLLEKTKKYSSVVLFIKDGVLICPLTNKKISVIDFNKNDKDNKNPIEICHEISVADEKICYDEKNKCIITAAAPNNLFFGYKSGNMMQQNMTIEEYHIYSDDQCIRRGNCVSKIYLDEIVNEKDKEIERLQELLKLSKVNQSEE